MIGTAARVRRVFGCIAGAAIVAVPVELILMLISRVNIDAQYYVQHFFFGYVSPWGIALPLALGLGVAIGLEVAETQPRQAIEQTQVWDRCIDLASLILLGILCGGLVSTFMYKQAADATVDTALALALAFLAFGLAAARTLTRWRVHNASAIRLAPFAATLGILYSLGMVAGAILARQVTYQPPGLLGWGFEFTTWPELLLTTTLYIGLPLGLWLATPLWLALILGRWAAAPHLSIPRRSHPKARRSAPLS